MSKLYAKYRKSSYNRGQGLYTLSYHFNQERQWYIDNKGVSIGDTLIPDNMYLEASKGRRLAICEYTADATFTDVDFTYDLESYTQNNTRVISVADTKTWIDANTDNTKLIKESDGVYYYEATDEPGGEPVKHYITID